MNSWGKGKNMSVVSFVSGVLKNAEIAAKFQDFLPLRRLKPGVDKPEVDHDGSTHKSAPALKRTDISHKLTALERKEHKQTLDIRSALYCK